MHIMYIETFRTAVIVSMDNVIMCLMSYWPIIFSIRISSLILIISLGGMKWKMFKLPTILLFYTTLICTLVRDLILLSLNCHNLQNFRYSIFPISKHIYNISYIIWYLRLYSHNTITIYYLIVKFYTFYKVYTYHFAFLQMDDVWSLNNSKFDDHDHIGDRILK
jgi:hypothetical protein